MNRREALNRVALLMGGAVLGTEFFLSGCKNGSGKDANALFEADQQALLSEIAETILPKTDTPGAKEAGVGAFMAVMVRDCYMPADQKIFMDGLAQLSGKGFLDRSAQERTQILEALNNEQEAYTKKKKKEDPNHYFRMMKELSLLGYFTSELGATKALRYVPVPGKYLGDYPYKKGEHAWALV